MLEWRAHPALTPTPRGFTLSLRPVLALDLGGTQIRAAAILPDGSRLARVARPTPSAEGAGAVVQACLTALLDAREAAPAEIRDGLAGIGISSPGPVDPARGIVVEPPNLGHDFRDVPLASLVAECLALPAFLDRDTNVAALGEQAFGAGRGFDDFLYITVSTGLGGAIVSDGRLIHGPDGMAGEIGHLQLAFDGPRCGCGGIAHLEAYASGVAIARDARALVEAGRSPFLAVRAAAHAQDGDATADRGTARDGIAALDARDVAEGEDAGDPACREVMDRARQAFAAACVGLTNLLNPSRIIVGGSLADNQGDRLLGPARREIRANTFSRPGARVALVPAELGADVSLAGALPLVAARLAEPGWRGSQSASHRPSRERSVALQEVSRS